MTDPLHIKYRPDIDGLRAIAVLAILGFHGFPESVRGGFVGVDIFFVISGYLISGILTRSLKNGQFSFSQFYFKRVKRLFPALLIVLFICLIVGWLFLYRDEFFYLASNVLGGLGFVSNFVLWKQASYFAKSSDLNPLVHLWSLGVEEQFYLIWPAILFFCWKFKGDRRVVISSLAILSFVANIAIVKSRPTTAFYLPMYRGWELLLGALLAEVSAKKTKNENFISILGLLIIFVGVFSLGREMPFPGWRALIPTLGAFLLIYSGPKAWVNSKILSARPLVFLGLISFPLYLWHWPLLSFSKIINPLEDSAILRAALVLLSVVLAWLTYLLIEKPLRTSSNKKTPTLLLATGVILFLLSLAIRRTDPLLTNHLQSQRDQLLWDEDDEKFNRTEECRNKFSLHGNDDKCLISKPGMAPTVALIGDSHANSLFFGWEKYLSLSTSDRENLINIGRGGCLPFWNTSSESIAGGAKSDCEPAMNSLLNQIVTSKTIHTVVLEDQGEGYMSDDAEREIGSEDMPKDAEPEEIYDHQLRLTVQKLLKAKKRVILALDFPTFEFDPRLCLSRFPFIGPRRPKCYEERFKIEERRGKSRSIILNVLKDYPKTEFVDFDPIYCETKFCMAMKNGVLLYRDKGHLSLAGSLYFADKIHIKNSNQRADAGPN